jgi:hypothetical protein
MSVLHSVIGRRNLLGSVLVGTIGVLLPVSAVHAEPPAGAELLAPSPSLDSPNAAVSGSSLIGAAAAAQPGEDMSIRPFTFRAKL